MGAVKPPADRKVKKADQVDAPGVLARFIGAPGGVYAGVDEEVTILEVVDDTVVCADDTGGQFKVQAGDGYFPEASGPLPGGVPTAEPTPGASGESDEARSPDHLHGLGAGDTGGVVQAPEGDPGEVAGVLPEVRPKADKG
jgi:hypothetical protein